MLNPPLNAKICVISARRFGDAVINAISLQAAGSIRPDIQWVIWTKPEFASLFEHMGFKNIITSQFPIAGGVPNTLKDAGISLLKGIAKLRKMRLDASVDFIGDSRESFLGSLIASKQHLSPRWGKAHWMSPLIWKASIPRVKYLPVKASNAWVYQIQVDLLSTLLGLPIPVLEKDISPKSSPKIAFHPFSSQIYKYWPTPNWEQLDQLLSEQGLEVTILCSAAEEAKARRTFLSKNMKASIVACSSVDQLITEIQGIDVLIGVDSFLVHLASALGKQSIVINTGNLPSWWQPPNSIALGQSGGCLSYPCSNNPQCLTKLNESQCIKSIAPHQVAQALNILRSN